MIKLNVASFTDAWIETGCGVGWTTGRVGSHLLQMRGLKLLLALVMVWALEVASFTDAWIETWEDKRTESYDLSHLLQMRGLKPYPIHILFTCKRRIFYRCVD